MVNLTSASREDLLGLISVLQPRVAALRTRVQALEARLATPTLGRLRVARSYAGALT